MENLLEQLNTAQQEAVINYQGASMVLAGAGSGKTRVLTYRIAYLISQGIPANKILALTFTNKAAKEMRERIGGLIGAQNSLHIWMGTFHSVFSKILRREADKIGYPSNFTIYDTIDAKSLLRAVIKDLGLDDKLYKQGLVYNRISAAKNNLISATAYINNKQIREEDRMMAKPKLGEIYQLYSQRCKKAGAMDFDDLLYKTYELFNNHPDVLNKYQNQFKYLLVDEYQDTNYAQYLIIKKIAALNKNICVVGDDAQSIYSFRGADIQNILNFKKDYPEVKTFKLEQNYRSTKTIVNAANSIIDKNKDQLKKNVWTANDDGAKIKVVRTPTDNEEGNYVANSIFETKMNEQSPNNDFAILYRTNAQSRAMEEALRKLNIPYKIFGGLSFYQRKEIKDIIAYFRLTVNPIDEEALKRVINYPARGIGKTSLDKILICANQNEISLWEVITNHKYLESILGSAAVKKIKGFTNLIESFKSDLNKKNAFDLASHIASNTGLLKDLYSDKTPEGVARYENIQELLNGVKQFVIGSEQFKPLDLFIEDIALLTDQDATDDSEKDKVSLMTIHAAKGLEFPYVFIVGLEENLFPSQLSSKSRTELEEERRLFYVAVTRAEKQAFLSYASTRFKWGNLIHGEKSRFIDEIDAEFIEETIQSRKKPSSKLGFNPVNTSSRNLKPIGKAPSKVFSTNNIMKSTGNEDIPVGSTVEHQRFGKGKLISLDGAGASKKATVDFEGIGSKQLLLKFARLKVIK